MIKNILVCLLLCAFLFSCGKERSIHVKAINPVTGDPYGNLRVVVSSSKTGFDGEVVKTVYDGNLNSEGEAMIPLKIKKNRYYIIECERPDNTCYTKDIKQYYAIQDEENPSFLFEYAECAYLKLKIENVNCQGPDDNFKLYYMGRQVGGQGDNIVGALSREGDGCYQYESNSFSDVPMGEVYYLWEVTRNGNTEVFTDTIYLQQNEYKTYEINY